MFQKHYLHRRENDLTLAIRILRWRKQDYAESIRDRIRRALELFPKNLESRSTTVEILNLLEQSGDRNQKSLAEHPKIPEYKLSRILKRLELGRFVIREKTGLDKMIRPAGRARPGSTQRQQGVVE